MNNLERAMEELALIGPDGVQLMPGEPSALLEEIERLRKIEKSQRRVPTREEIYDAVRLRCSWLGHGEDEIDKAQKNDGLCVNRVVCDAKTCPAVDAIVRLFPRGMA